MTQRDDTGRLKVLHSVGHLSRGGIETWLHGVISRLDHRCFEHHVMVWTDEEEAYTAEFRAAGARIHAVGEPTRPWRFARNLRRLLQREPGGFDILHTHGTHLHGLVMLLAACGGIEARIAHSHTDIRPVLQASGLGYRLYARLGHTLIRRLATRGLAVSDAAGLSLFGRGWRRDARHQLLFCGIDLAPFANAPDPGLRTRLGLPPAARVFGHVGRFESQKNHRFLIEIIEDVSRREPRGHFLLIGDGSLFESSRVEIERRGLTARVTLLRDCRTVPAHMLAAMDGFVLPSLYEGLGLAAVEAQAAGLACLLSDAVPREAGVIAGRSRFLPLRAGAPAWAEALLDLPPRTDPRPADLPAEIAGRGFDIDDASRALARCYQAVAGRQRRTPAAARAAVPGARTVP